MLEIILIFLFYLLIGAIIEFLMVFGVLIYAKRHSKSDAEFIEAWNKASDVIMISSLSNINQDVSFAFQFHVCACVFIWPLHILINILITMGTYVFNWIDRLFYKLASVLVKR